LRLVACPSCHTQYDVSDVIAESISCRCGEALDTKPLAGVDAQVHRCGSCGAIVGAEAESCEFCGSAIVRDTRKLSLICPECYGRNAEDARFCTSCGVLFQPEAIAVDGFELPCPCCGCLMPVRQVGGMAINECPECNGLWVPEDKFDLMVGRAIEAQRSADPAALGRLSPRVKGGNPATQRVQYRKCPQCEGFMRRRNFRKTSGVIIDRCHEHGTWLDADELERIAGFILSGGRPAAAEHMRRTEANAEEQYRKARREAITLQHQYRSALGARHGAAREGSLLGLLASLFD
jgi:Zn-finger nucleic acid-binding protein/ribosomal protein L40E